MIIFTKWIICSIFYITLRYTNGQGMRGAIKKIMDATGDCGTVRVLSQGDVYVFRDQDARLHSRRFKRSASGFDSEERFDDGQRHWGTGNQPGNVPKSRGSVNSFIRSGSAGRNSGAMTKPRLATIFSNFSHRVQKEFKKPIPDIFMEIRGKFNDERRKFPPLLRNLVEVKSPSKPVNKKDILKEIKSSDSKRGNMRKVKMIPPTINLISPVSEAPPVPDHKHVETPDEGKLPLYIEHILQDNVRNGPVLSKRPMPKTRPEVKKPEMNYDILGSLGPEKLAQLRNLLNSGYGGGGDVGQYEIDSIDEGRSPRRRQKRSTEKLAKGQSCNWIFTSECKIIVKFDYIIDGVSDCSREYLKINAANTTELFCGAGNRWSNHLIEGEGKVSIEHFRSSEAGPHDKIRFKGSVYCG